MEADGTPRLSSSIMVIDMVMKYHASLVVDRSIAMTFTRIKLLHFASQQEEQNNPNDIARVLCLALQDERD
jgi:hypothetical protein